MSTACEPKSRRGGFLERTRIVMVRIVLTVLALTLAGCNDDPVRPGPVHYNVYIAALDWVDGVATDPLYIIDADSMVVIDSIPQIGSLYDMEVSPDGRFLYNCVHRRPGSGCAYDSVRCIDVRSKKTIWSVPSGDWFPTITVLDNGRIILRRSEVCGSPARIIDLLDAATGEVIKTLPDSIRYGEGPVTGTKVAGEVGEYPDSRLVGVDVMTGEVWGEFVPRFPGGPPMPVSFLRLHPDGDKVLVMGGVDVGVSYAIVGSLNTGDDIVRGRIYSPAGEGEFSADGRLAITSDLNGSLAVFDLDSTVHLGTIAAPASQVSFIGDEYCVVTAMFPDYAQGTHPLAHVDLASLEITRFAYLPLPEPLLGAMAVGPRP